ncbi:MAG: DUF456 domain-containing protein [Verrucomicrobiota bacterium]
MSPLFHLAINWSQIGSATLDSLIWVFIGILMIAGLVGTALPVLPGTIIIFLAAVLNFAFIGPPHSIEWTGLIVLLFLVILSYIVDFAGGAVGAKWFGATKWGAIGAIVGGIVGMFFMPFGLIIGPLAGAIIAEIIFAKRSWKPATKSGVGSVVGTAGGIAGKLTIALIMIAWFFFDVFFFKAPF